MTAAINGATPIPLGPGAREALELFKRELITYCQNLEQFLGEGDEGRYVVIRGETVLGTWDSYRDALQHGYHCCGAESFFVHRIIRRDVWAMEKLMRQEGLWPSADLALVGVGEPNG